MKNGYLTEAERDELLATGGLFRFLEFHELVIVTPEEKKRLSELNADMMATYADSQRTKATEKEPLLLLIEKLQFIMYSARREQPGISPTDAVALWQKRNEIDGLGHKDLLGFLDLLTDAVVENDADIFLRFSKALGATTRRSDKELFVTCLHVTFHELQDGGILFPTKRQVRELAVRKYAIKRYLDRAIDKKTLYTVNAEGKKEFTAKAIRDLQREEQLIEKGRNWHDFWGWSGLRKLDEDPGGQPSHRKKHAVANYRWPYPE